MIATRGGVGIAVASNVSVRLSPDADTCHGLFAPETPGMNERRKMMVRNSRFEMRLTKSEFTDLTRKARKAGLSTAAFVRKAVAGTEVKEAPPVDVPVLIMEVRKVGSSLNQILKIAEARRLMDASEIRIALAENRAVEKMISKAYGGAWR